MKYFNFIFINTDAYILLFSWPKIIRLAFIIVVSLIILLIRVNCIFFFGNMPLNLPIDFVPF